MEDPESKGVKKKGSFRSLFSRFLRPASRGEVRDTSCVESTGSNSSAPQPTSSTVSLHSDVRPPTEPPSSRQPDPPIVDQNAPSFGQLPNGISPPFSRTPGSSSSSASSVDCGSETSSPITTPSNSSLSVLMKGSDAALDPVTAQRAHQTQESSHTRRSPTNPMPHRKQPSPLSTVTDIHSPYSSGAAPNLAPSRTLRAPVSPKRRSSISRLLIRRSRSASDLTLSDDEDIPPGPSIPQSAPSSRPTSAVSTASSTPSIGRRLSLLRRPKSSSSRPASVIGDLSVDIDRSKEEHLLILGADPSGPGFYLYPPTRPEQISRRRMAGGAQGRQMNRWSIEDYKRRSWSGVEQAAFENCNGRMLGAHPRRGRPGLRGQPFRGNVASQVIMEECSEGRENPAFGMRRRSGVPHGYEDWQGLRAGIEGQPTWNQGAEPVSI